MVYGNDGRYDTPEMAKYFQGREEIREREDLDTNVAKPSIPTETRPEIPVPLTCTYDPDDHHEIKLHDGSGFYGDGNGKYWCDVHEIHRLTTHAAVLEKALRASERLRAGKYMEWGYAGGRNMCKHGYAEGIACDRCDEDTVRDGLAALERKG